jgi:L-amino acid N-acyltransferase YncA
MVDVTSCKAQPGVIRVATIADAAGVQAIYGPEVEHGAASFETEAPTPEDMAARIAAILPMYPWLVWEEGGEILGYAYASRHRDRAAYRWSVDAAIYVAPQAHGRGIARALYARLFEILSRQRFRAAYGGVTTTNPASEALHRACGFELVGVYRAVGYKHGAWRDVGWWRRTLSETPGQPPEPIPFAELRETLGL